MLACGIIATSPPGVDSAAPAMPIEIRPILAWHE
jgi:hypothetical protein